MENTKIKSALISVYHKDGLDRIVKSLINNDVLCYSTGGTADYLTKMGAKVEEVADLTGYPSILAGRVKTLHPKVHGGILARRGEAQDLAELEKYEIPMIDLVIVDLYPFEETVASGASDEEIIEKIDIGGIALIRGAAKNFGDVVIIPSQAYYGELADILEEKGCATSLADRKYFASRAFDVSSHYDSQIFKYMSIGEKSENSLKITHSNPKPLRYGENPHQKAFFYGDLEAKFEQLNGKELSYNNMVDIEGALQLVKEFQEPFFAIIKHTNPCGCATGKNALEAWTKALASDPVSAFGGVIACNQTIDLAVAEAIHDLFFEVLVAPDFTAEAKKLLSKKKNRILLRQKEGFTANKIVKSVLDGVLVQDCDTILANPNTWEVKTSRKPTQAEIDNILFGEKVVKHLKSNAIAIVKDGQLIGGGLGQTSRIDALKQAVQKSKEYNFDLNGSVLASDAFFPFTDSVEFAKAHGIEVVVEPGGSLRDEDIVKYCEENGMCLVFTGLRHFKH